MRALRAARGTTVIAFLVLTLAIAASTVTFSVVDTVVLRRLPFEADHELIAISRVTTRSPWLAPLAAEDYFSWQERQTSFDELAASGLWTGRLQTPTGGACRHLVLGAAIGLAAAWAGSRVFESVLFGVKPTDPLVYAGVVLVLLATGLAAAWLPARRASRVDPLIALRAE